MLTKMKNSDNDTPSPSLISNTGQTIIGKDVSIEGSIKGKENLVIEGNLKGSIVLEDHQVTVGPQGQVEGEIYAENITISGQMAGNINAKNKVEITKDADFSGEIKAKRMSVEEGAYIKTVVELERDQQKKAGGPDNKPMAQSVPE